MLWFYILYSEYVKNRRRFDPLFFLDAKLKNVAVKKCITDKYLNLSRNLSRIVISSEFIKRKKQNWLGSTQLHFDAISFHRGRPVDDKKMIYFTLITCPRNIYIYIARYFQISSTKRGVSNEMWSILNFTDTRRRNRC